MNYDANDEDLDIRDGGALFVKDWWNMCGGASLQLQHLATWVFSQLVNTSSVEKCLATSSVYCFGCFGLHILVCRWPIL